MPYRLKRSESVSEGVRRIAREQAEAGLARSSEARISVEARIHDARTRCKKIRGLLRLVRRPLGEIYKRENGILRGTAHRLSPVRDAAVVLQTFENLIRAERFGRAATSAVRKALKARREAAQELSDPEALLAKFSESFRELIPRIETWCFDDDGFRAVWHGLRRSYRQSRRTMRAAPDGAAAGWHECRRRSKDHWFHMRLLTSAWRPEMEARASALKRLSDLLGEDHDLVVLRNVVSESPELSAAHESLIALIETRQSTLRADSFREGERLFAEKPAAFTKRMKAYWKVWRRAEAS